MGGPGAGGLGTGPVSPEPARVTSSTPLNPKWEKLSPSIGFVVVGGQLHALALHRQNRENVLQLY